MKIKFNFLLLMALIVLFSIGTAAATDEFSLDSSIDDNGLSHASLDDDLGLDSSIDDNDLSHASLDDDLTDDEPPSEDDSGGDSPEGSDGDPNANLDNGNNDGESNDGSGNDLNGSDSNQDSGDGDGEVPTAKYAPQYYHSEKGYSGSPDLSVKIKVNSTNPKIGSTVKWTVIVKNKHAIAYECHVETVFNGLSFLYFDANLGTYNFNTGIWEIGDLNSSQTAILTIYTKVTESNAIFSAGVSTDSIETSYENNFDSKRIQAKNAVKKPKFISSNSGESSTLDEKKHNEHYASSATGVVQRVKISDGNSLSNGVHEGSSYSNDAIENNSSSNGSSENHISKEVNLNQYLNNVNNILVYLILALGIVGIIFGILYKKR